MTRDHLNLQTSEGLGGDGRDDPVRDALTFRKPCSIGQKVIMLQAHPGRLREVVEIDLPYPREIEQRDTPEFTRYSAHLRKLLEDLLMAVVENTLTALEDSEAAELAAAKRDRFAAILTPIATAAGLVIIWELGVRGFSVPTYIAPSPSQVAIDPDSGIFHS